MRRLRIFISSPGDVQKERQVAQRIIARLAVEFADRVALDPYFWEYEPMRITAGFQAQIPAPSDFDIVVCILWSRLGTPLKAPDGRHYKSGTEYEVNAAIAAHRERGAPDVLVYHSRTPAQIRRSPKEAREQAYRQVEALEDFLEKLAIDPVTGTIKGAIIRYADLAEFEERVEQHLRKLIDARAGEPTDADNRAAPAVAWADNPFRGLELFEFEHAAIFFGRTKAIGEIVDMLRRQARRVEEDTQSPQADAALAAIEAANGTDRQQHRSPPATFVLISAMSGAGKSSLVRAGVLPLLTRPGVVEGVGLWRRAIMLPSGASGDLFDSLAQALIQPEALPELTSGEKDARQVAAMLRRSQASVDLLISQTLAHTADLLRIEEDRELENMIETYRAAGRTEDAERCTEVRRNLKPRAARLVLVIDQLEEIFTLPKFRDAPDAAAAFVAALAALARSGNVFVIATLRSDFFGRCAEISELMALKQAEGHYDLALPTAAEIGQIIRQPAVAAGLHYETIGKPNEEIDLDERVRDDAMGHPEALPLLEYCLSGLYELRQGNLLTHESYVRLGGVEAALAKRAEDVFKGLSRSGQDAFDPVMRRLTTASREKAGLAYARSWADYDRLSVLAGAKEFIDAFVGNRARLFIAGQDETGRAVVTLTHEALLRAWPRLARWLTANSEMLQVKAAVAGATNQWVKAKRDAGYLLPRGLQLENAKQAARDGYLEKVEAEFVQASIQAERKTIVRRRLVLAALFGVITAAAGAATQYGWQRYDQGRLSIDSNEPTARIQIDDLQLGLPVTNLEIRSGRHMLRAFAEGDIDRTQSVDIARGSSVPAEAHFWLESGLGWKYTSPSVQGGLAILPDPSGGPSLIAHNEISQIIFLSAADGAVVKTISTPTGNWRAFKMMDLGGDVGKVVVSGLDQENSGPELLVIRGTAPPQVLWSWKGPATGYGTQQSLVVEPLPRPDGRSDLLVAGRDGKVYLLDGKTGKQLESFTIADKPLAMPPTILAWQNGQDTIITLLLRPGDPNRLADMEPNLIGTSFRFEGRVPLWRKDLGGGWNPFFPPLQIEGHPQVFLWNDKNWQMIDLATGAPRSMGGLPGPLVAGPAIADIQGNGNPDLIFEFADSSRQMVAVNPADGAIVWHGPAGLNPRSQPRGPGSSILRTSTGALLVLTEDALAAVDPHSGQIVWRAAGVPRGVLIGDWDGDGTNEILVTIGGVGLRCLDEAGRERWTLRLSDDVEPWTLIELKDGGSRNILIHRHASLISLVHGPRMLWQANATAAIQANPIVARDARGKAIVIDTAQWGNDVYMRAFDGTFGKILWSAKDNLSDNRGATLADLDGTGQSYVVVVALPVRGNRLLVYRAADGKLVRDQPIALNTWLACAPAVADYRGTGKSDVAFSTWDDRSIVMADGRSGEILWRYQIRASTMGGVTSADLDGDGLPDVIAATLDGNVYALRGKDGNLLWKTPIPGGSWSVPLIATLDPKMPPYVLVTTISGGLYVLNSRTGETVWSPSISQAQGREIVTMNDLKVSGHATVVKDGDRTVILAPMGAAGVVAFDWVSKTELWRSPRGRPVLTTPAPVELTGQRGRGIVVAAATGDVWTLALADGEPLWHTQIPAKTIDADPAVADLNGDGVPDILVAGFDFSLRAINGVGTAIARSPEPGQAPPR